MNSLWGGIICGMISVPLFLTLVLFVVGGVTAVVYTISSFTKKQNGKLS